MTQSKQPLSSLIDGIGTNPDLAVESFGKDSRLPDRRILGKFPQP